jgi:hypothetical protein
MSVSSPSCILSAHGATRHTLIAEHNPLAQSVPVLHVAPTSHGGHVPPPQSVLVSAPFCTLSVHDGAWHVVVQTPSLQSAAALQVFPSSHAGHLVPPQSTSVSVPLSIPSVHVGAGGVHVPFAHSFDWQSSAPEQGPPFGQGVVDLPQLGPLSTLDVLPSLCATAPSFLPLSAPLVPMLPLLPSVVSALSPLPPSLALPIAVVSPLVEHAATHPTTAQHESSSRHALPIEQKYLE